MLTTLEHSTRKIRQADPYIGREIGNFLVLSHLATGGMCELYTGVHMALERHAALKMPRVDLPYSEILAEQLLSEARLLASVHHSNVVEVYDLGWSADETPFLALELLMGAALDEVLYEHGRLSVPTAVRIARETARGLMAFHRDEIVCIDVKPENVMVVNGPLVPRQRAGEVWVKLIDLGAGVRMRDQERPDAELRYMGTPAYASPEVALRRPVTPTSDVYNLGLMLYEMLTGDLPYCGRTTEEWLRHHVTTEAPRLSEQCDDIGRGTPLDEFVSACLRKNPKERPASMLEVLKRLDEAESHWSANRSREITQVTPLPDGILR